MPAPGPSPLTRGNPSSRPGPTSPWGVHPRSRGATEIPGYLARSREGPSPLTRGNLRHRRADRLAEGSIPAHAGQPQRVNSGCSSIRVHPRSRGATIALAGVMPPITGPSPLTRGNPDMRRRDARRAGSIPAHAGQPRRWHSEGAISRVHPRSRGATFSMRSNVSPPLGPSPLTRGNRLLRVRLDLLWGSIPAHAGQPVHVNLLRRQSRVHPRSRGATWTPVIRNDAPRGPSPLTRGNPADRVAGHQASGSIPAHAGQPPRTPGPAGDRWVHPRSRGATRPKSLRSRCQRGPSPLTRGNLGAVPQADGAPGSIPAHAGQPWWCWSPPGATRVHPRSRGATDVPQGFGSVEEGPSPLTRGNRVSSADAVPGAGSIPAHAGQPTSGSSCRSSRRVHPRSRGATGGEYIIRDSTGGPSPLTRGNPCTEGLRRDGDGSIPAHAGQPDGDPRQSFSVRVHPRSRGATLTEYLTAQHGAGPSPLTRGNQLHFRRRGRSGGSIPAHAGQPHAAGRALRRRRVHPRSRGATSLA